MLKGRAKKTVAMLITGIMLATCAWTGNVHAQSKECSGLAEKDVYYPEKEDVVPDPILNWAIRSAMNKNDEKFVLTRGCSIFGCAVPFYRPVPIRMDLKTGKCHGM